MKFSVLFTSALLLFIASFATGQEPPKKELPLSGEVFLVDGRTAFLIPAKIEPAAKSKPWVWYAPTLPNLPGKEEQWMFEEFTRTGIAIAGIDAGESYGSPAGNKVFTSLYNVMTSRGYSAKPVMLGRSRGGLMALSWATANPEKVGGFAGIYPVSDLASYPGVAKAAGAFEMSAEELQKRLKEFNPIDRLEALAKVHVPLFAIHGDIDKVVPLEANSGLIKDRYAALGGSMKLIVPPGQGHNMWRGFFECCELVEFVKMCGLGMVLYSPLNFQVVQRNSKESGGIVIHGALGKPAFSADEFECRLVSKGMAGDWRKLNVRMQNGHFVGTLDAPAGGWYRLEVRAQRNGSILAEATVEHVGAGEVFVIAGQSNSANHGEEKQTVKSNRVVNFDGKVWRVANDPQPGASGEGGSFVPTLGDALAEKFGVPVGFVCCGVGATSVREWLAKGSRFPDPPTLEGNVRKLPSGEWESTGVIYDRFLERMKPLGLNGFRAVLWHQGESDANQADSSRSLTQKQYREYLEKVIAGTRHDLGWNMPWFVAQVSYHAPGDEASPEIRAAQASLWKDGVALEGPDGDALQSEFRDSGGKGVHFSRKGLRELAKRWEEKIVPWVEQQLESN